MKTALEQLDRMEALCRKMAALGMVGTPVGASSQIYAPYADYQEARAIVADLPAPVDPLLFEARNICAKLCSFYNSKCDRVQWIKDGSLDHDSDVDAIYQALRRARKEGVR